MENIENARECALNVLNFRSTIFNIQKYLKENFNTESYYNIEDGKMYLWANDVNESLSVTSAKEYVDRTINTGMISEIIYSKPEGID